MRCEHDWHTKTRVCKKCNKHEDDWRQEMVNTLAHEQYGRITNAEVLQLIKDQYDRMTTEEIEVYHYNERG